MWKSIRSYSGFCLGERMGVSEEEKCVGGNSGFEMQLLFNEKR